MKVQQRQQILEMWEATARSSFHEGKWAWGGRDEANSISDAEQLLCLMLPAAELPAFRLDSPDETAEDVLDALLLLGDAVETPKLLVRVITDYLRNYTDASGPATALDNPNRMFECGWSWGIVQAATDIKTVEIIGPQRRGLAPATPS